MSRSPLRLRRLPALAWRNLAQHRARTALSVLAVAAGVASVVGTNVLNRAILAAIGSSPDTQAITSGLMTQLETSLLGAGVAIALAAGFLVLNAFLMSVTERRQQLGVLRALGMPRRMLLQLIVMEALIVAGLGSALGLGAGPLLARLIGQLLRETTVNAFAPQAPSLAVLAAATGLGVGVAVAAGLVPAVQAMRTSPLEALRDQPATAAPKQRSRRRRQAQAGLIAGAALWIYLIAAPPARWVWSPLSWWLLGLADLLWAVCVALLLPGLIGVIGRLARRLLPGAMGRLTADNLRRSRGRVTLTAAGMATGLALITGMTGFFAFFFGELMGTSLERLNDPEAMLLTSFEFTQGLGGYADLDSLRLPEEAVEAVRRAVGERAEVVPFHFTMVPELGFLTADYFSMIADPEPLSRTGETVFRFAEGDWQRALPVLEAGCGVLITPMVADMNGVGLYDRIDVTGIDGPVACTVAGIGQPMGGATFISGAARDRFVLGDPINALVMPSPETRLDPSALARLEADIQAVAAQQGIFATGLDVLAGTLLRTGDTVLNMVNGVLLVMLLLAALGVVNTTLISVTERRHELGLLRAVGATRRQVSRLIVGEAVLTGIAGGLLGLVAGLGLTVAAVLVFGGRAFGLPDLDLWEAAAEAALPALRNGIFGLLAAPAICALAAGTAARRLVPPAAMRMTVAGQSLGEDRRRTRSIHIRRLTSLALRNLAGARAKSVLSALAVALGTSMVVAANVAGSGFRSAFASEESRQAFAFMFDAFEASLNAVGIVVLAAAAFLILNAFGMAVVQRRRQIGALRALGMTRRQVMRLVLSEALLIGGTGTLAGIVLGLPLGRGLIGLVRSAGYETGEGRMSPAVLAVAVGLGLGLTMLSSLMPARSAGRVSPLVALRSETMSDGKGQAHSRLPLLGLALIAVPVIGVILAPPGEWAAPPWNGWAALLLALLWLAGLGIVLPALVGVVASLGRRPLGRLFGAAGRLVADNLGRERRRVTLTILTLAVGSTVIVSLTGIASFNLSVLFRHVAAGAVSQPRWNVYPDLSAVDPTLETFAVKPEVIADVQALAAGRARVGGYYYVFVPEISELVPNFPSVMADPDTVLGPGGFAFTRGDLDSARRIMEAGCGLLLSPGVAGRYGVGPGDTLTVTGLHGPVDCTVAGLGTGAFFYPTSVISLAAREQFQVGETPSILQVAALPGADVVALSADLNGLAAGYGADADVRPLEDELTGLLARNEMFVAFLDSLLLLAVAAALLGMVNTTLISVTERRRELGLLRAVGATRRLIRQVVTGEAGMMGLIAGALGLVAGGGVCMLFALSYGGASYGLPDLPLWQSAWEATRPALSTGLLGFVVTPVLAAASAWLPARAIVRGTPVESMLPEPQVRSRRLGRRFLRSG